MRSRNPPRRRSCLSVPASAESKVTNAPSLGADEIVLDLEDAVAAHRKADARLAAVAAVQHWPGGAVAVRINESRSPWAHEDLVAVAGAAAQAGDNVHVSVIVPKVDGPEDIARVERILSQAEIAAGSRRPVGMQVLIETAAGLLSAAAIAGASDRVETLILGYADLAADLGRTAAGAADLDGWRFAQEHVLVSARCHGVEAIDGPYLGTRVDDHFVAALRRASEVGFDGKWSIHPAQVESINQQFSPTEDEVGHAREVLVTLEASEEAGQGAVLLGTNMIDEAHRKTALRVLARAGL